MEAVRLKFCQHCTQLIPLFVSSKNACIFLQKFCTKKKRKENKWLCHSTRCAWWINFRNRKTDCCRNGDTVYSESLLHQRSKSLAVFLQSTAPMLDFSKANGCHPHVPSLPLQLLAEKWTSPRRLPAQEKGWVRLVCEERKWLLFHFVSWFFLCCSFFGILIISAFSFPSNGGQRKEQRGKYEGRRERRRKEGSKGRKQGRK